MRPLATLLALLAALATSGCSSILLGVANGADLANGAYRREAEVRYGPGERATLDVYRPSEGGAPVRGLVVFVHGGRWSYGDKRQYRFVAAGLAARGFVVMVPNYRLYPAVRMAEAAADVASAVAFAEKTAARYGADPASLVMMGHSAGAHLAALVTYDPAWLRAAGATPPRAFAGFAGPYDFLPLKDADLIDYFGPPAHYPTTQPVNFVDAASAPAFIVQGLADTTVALKNSRSLAAHLEAAGVHADLHLMPAEDHGGVLKRFARFYRGHDPLYEALIEFLAAPPVHAAAG